MKLTNIALICTIFFSFACNDMDGKVELETKKDSLSYAIGIQWGTNLKADDIDLDLDVVKAGIEDYFKDDVKLNDEEVREIITQLQQDIQQKRMKQQQEASSENKKEAEKFLAENKDKPGVKVTESGLQYKVLKEGTGKSPSKESKVKVHYHGTLLDGTVFDSSVERGEPAEFPLNQVIPGWTEGVQLMKEGAKYKFFIPPSLGYGAQGSGSIGPNQLLIFEVELLEVK